MMRRENIDYAMNYTCRLLVALLQVQDGHSGRRLFIIVIIVAVALVGVLVACSSCSELDFKFRLPYHRLNSKPLEQSWK